MVKIIKSLRFFEFFCVLNKYNTMTRDQSLLRVAPTNCRTYEILRLDIENVNKVKGKGREGKKASD